MKRNSVGVIFLFSVIIFLVQSSDSVEDEVKTTLINFVTKLSTTNTSNGATKPGLLSSWNSSSDPCADHWKGVICGAKNRSVRKLFLNSSNLAGEPDFALLCNSSEPLAASLTVLHLENNGLAGELSSAVSSCRKLTHLHLGSNRLSGPLPSSLAELNNLKLLDVSNNELSGAFPELSGISGLAGLLAQNNRFSGEVPRLDFSNLRQFNVSNNRLSGRVPDNVRGHFHANSFLGNPSLCGDPTPNHCPSPQPEDIAAEPKNDPSSNKNQIVMFVGYIALGIVVVLIVLFLLYKRKNNNNSSNEKKVGDESASKQEGDQYDQRSSYNSSAIVNASEVSAEKSAVVVVLTSPEAKGLRFEELLRAPAEMLGRGKDGSLYKVSRVESGKSPLVVKRIKNWEISRSEFKQRMERLDQVRHPNVLPPLAFYSSREEKLLVYEFQQNGSLFNFLHGTNNMAKLEFDWSSRLGVASRIAEALALMHHSLRDSPIPHGNLKSSNILFNADMEPCLSEYGLTPCSAFSDDVRGLGVVLLELLTGKPVSHNGVELAEWVRSVVTEEWTGEVFDEALRAERASEERMVGLLRLAVGCVDRAAEARPAMDQVVAIINSIKEEEERSALASGP